MAQTPLQTIKIESGSGTANTGTITPTAGNTLVVTAYTNSTATTGTMVVSDNQNAAYTVESTGAVARRAGGNARQVVTIAHIDNCVGALTTITLTGDANSTGVVAFAQEWSNTATSSSADATSPAISTAGTTGLTSFTATTNALTNATANAAFVALVGCDTGSGAVTLSSSGTGWTLDNSELNATSFYPAGVAHKVVSSVAAQTETWAYAGGTASYAATIAVYKAAAAGTYVPYDLPHSPQHQSILAA